ncbi:MAG: hypothetical protein J6R50_02070 [Alistipes sp.]|nr:hypothetical protein [Alistipes sp.]
MRKFILVSIVSMISLTFVSCSDEFWGIDSNATISMNLYGSGYGWRGEKFSSSTGIFNDMDHPEFVIKDSGGFTLDLYRYVTSEEGNSARLNIYINNSVSPLELDRVYSLVLLGDAMACLEFSERGATKPLPGGGSVTEYITRCYKALDGYVIFTRAEEYGSDYKFSGEFSFTGWCEELGDTVEVRNGKFEDCRICVSIGQDCNSDKVSGN